jgi:replication factor C small subunit
MEVTNSLWVEKYRPQTLDTYLGNDEIKGVFEKFIKDNDFPHLLLGGRAGIGKTTIAKLLVKNIDCDSLYINASDDNKVETIRTRVKSFAAQRSFAKIKIVILDEGDYLSASSQAALRNIIEQFSSTTRFIITCNYAEKIIEALQSRCLVLDLKYPTKAEVAKHCMEILKKENVKCNLNELKEVVESNYPDIRSIIKILQISSTTGKLNVLKTTIRDVDFLNTIVDKLINVKDVQTVFNDLRQSIADNGINDFTELYSYLYERIDDYAVGNKAQVILLIADYQHKDAFAVNKTINAMALLIEILMCITK